MQVAALALFEYLLFGSLRRLDPLPLAKVSFRFDPLAAPTAMLAGAPAAPG